MNPYRSFFLFLGAITLLWSAKATALESPKSTESSQTQPDVQGAIDAKSWMEQAQEILKKQEPGALDYKKIQCSRGIYTIVYQMDGTCLLQSREPKEVDSNGLETTDSEGKKYIKAMIETAKTSGKGWLDFQWMDPEAKKMRTNGIYFQKIEGQEAVLGCVFPENRNAPVLKERPKLTTSESQKGDAGKSRVFNPELNLIMHWCPPGTFTMGSDNPAKTLHDNPPHQVTLTHGYWIGETEVTQAQWEAVMEMNPASPSSRRGDGIDTLRSPAVSYKEPNFPAISITWDQMMDFCKKLTEREQKAGRLPVGAIYTLPTEAQWFNALEAGSNDPVYKGDLDSVAWYGTISDGMLHPVAQKLPNAWGLYDMYGNAWEACSDWFGDFTADAVTDPTGPPSGDSHVLRGGGWDAGYKTAHMACRKALVKDGRRYYISFRIICTAGFP